MRVALLAILIFVIPTLSLAAHFPKLTGRVVDDANLFDQQTRSLLTDALKNHEIKTSNQIVVVTVKSLEGLSEQEYATKVGNLWGIGQKGKNNGVIILTAMKERKIRIQVGDGLTRVLTNDIAKEIIDQAMSPAFKSNNYNSGIVDGIQRVIAVLDKNEEVSLFDYMKSIFHDIFDMLILAVMLPVIILLKLFGFRIFGVGGSSFTGGGGGFGGGGASGSF